MAVARSSPSRDQIETQRMTRSRIAHGSMSPVLQFDRQPLRTPHLVAVDGGRAGEVARPVRRRMSVSVVLVIVATVLAVMVDLVDHVPTWSPLAIAISVGVIAAHVRLTQRRAD
jgi:hypothetical protein